VMFVSMITGELLIPLKLALGFMLALPRTVWAIASALVVLFLFLRTYSELSFWGKLVYGLTGILGFIINLRLPEKKEGTSPREKLKLGS